MIEDVLIRWIENSRLLKFGYIRVLPWKVIAKGLPFFCATVTERGTLMTSSLSLVLLVCAFIYEPRQKTTSFLDIPWN